MNTTIDVQSTEPRVAVPKRAAGAEPGKARAHEKYQPASIMLVSPEWLSASAAL